MRFLFVGGLLGCTLFAGCGGVARQASDGPDGGRLETGGGGGSAGIATGGHDPGGKPGTGGRVGGAGGYPVGGGGPLPFTGGYPGSGGGIPEAGGYYGTGGVFPGTGGFGCCLAIPTCDPGDPQVPYDPSCGADPNCYTKSLCCSTIACRHECTKKPACLPGEIQISSTSTCPTNGQCYVRSYCGVVISCFAPFTQDGGAVVDAGTCDGPPPRGVSYISHSNCGAIDYACPAGVDYYSDNCGCGCRQSASCPDYVDCMPGPQATNPLCSDPKQCPYSPRAL